MKKTILFTILIFISVIAKSQNDTTISTFVNVHQGNGNGLATRTVIDTFYFPEDVSMYDTIQMNVMLNCPVGGCDPWDRYANVSVYNDGEWFEIGRYMTPYGISCGWTIDVSDYREFLTDTVIIKSFIDTWTNPGWLVNFNFHFSAGTPMYPFITIDNLWNIENVVYGDTTQPVNIPERSITIDPGALGVKVKIVNTGHGQGNLNNAAEFSQKTHVLTVESQTFNHFLWRNDCATNPCSPQAGTWQYNRAGWCPGADVIPAEFDVTSIVSPGITNSFKYELQNYFNTCSPNNPGCVSGSTCADCNYNYNGHTEPHYKIAGQVISYLSTSTGINKNHIEQFSVIPNPSNGIFTFRTSGNSTYHAGVYSIIGKLEWAGKTGNGQQIDLSFVPKGIYILKIYSGTNAHVQRLVIE